MRCSGAPSKQRPPEKGPGEGTKGGVSLAVAEILENVALHGDPHDVVDAFTHHRIAAQVAVAAAVVLAAVGAEDDPQLGRLARLVVADGYHLALAGVAVGGDVLVYSFCV